jgi:(2Fe-2S) ferredoxin
VKVSSVRRRLQLFVCTNQRRDDDPLGGGCGARGEEVHAAFVRAIATRRAWSSVWLARASCLGVCPRVGCAVAVAPGGALIEEVVGSDAEAILDAMLAPKA